MDRTPREKLILSELGLTSLPELPQGLRELVACQNRLTSLPTLPRSLRVLDVEENELAALPALPPHLIVLIVNDNNLTELPALPATLTSLQAIDNDLSLLPPLPASLNDMSVDGNALTALPQELPSALLVLNATRNNLTDLPDSIADLPVDCQVELEDNNFSDEVVARIMARVEANLAADSLRGPIITFEPDLTPASPEEPDMRVQQAVSEWLQAANRTLNQEQQGSWDDFAASSPAASRALANQLGRLRLTAHYQHAPEDMTDRIGNVLVYMSQHADVRDTCASIAIVGTETCHDRIALAFIDMEEAVVTHLASTANPPMSTLENIGAAMFRSNLLKSLAMRKADALTEVDPGTDPVEIVLRYWVALSGEAQLDLPSKMSGMLFPDLAARITPEDIAAAGEEVLARERSNELFEYLGAWQPWRQHLETHHPQRYHGARQAIAAQQTALRDTLDDLVSRQEQARAVSGEWSDACLELSHQIGEIKSRYERIEPELLGELSRRVLQEGARAL